MISRVIIWTITTATPRLRIYGDVWNTSHDLVAVRYKAEGVGSFVSEDAWLSFKAPSAKAMPEAVPGPVARKRSTC